MLNIDSVDCFFRLVMLFNNSSFKVDTSNPDSKLVGSDGSSAVHSLLLIVHSSLLKQIFSSLVDQTEVVVIVPDACMSDLNDLVAVVNGHEDIGFVSGGILDTLGMQQYKIWTVFSGSFSEDHIDLSALDNDIELEVSLPIVQNSVAKDAPLEDAFANEAFVTPFDDLIVSEVSEHIIVNEVEITEPISNEVMTCPICDKIMKTNKTLKQHMRLKHVDNPRVIQDEPLNKKCCICNQYLTASQLNQHMKDKHPGQAITYNCDLCEVKLNSVFNLKRHKENIHSENKRFECIICGEFRSQRGDKMKEHMEIHNVKQFGCDICSFKSNRKRELEVHNKLRCKPKLFSCDLCEKKSASKNALRQHKQVHFCNNIIFLLSIFYI